jgi:hypothetical protein
MKRWEMQRYLAANIRRYNMLKELIKIANELDNRGLVKEADKLDEITKEAFGGLCVMLLSGLIGCKKTVEERTWGTDSEDPQPIAFEALDSEGYVLFDQNDFASSGQAAFGEGCAVKMEWAPEIKDSVEINSDGTVLWRYVDGNDPVLTAIGYPITDGNWDVTFKVGDTDRDGETCYLSLSVVSAGKSSGYSRTETF